jgi:hypothetical protein
MAMVSGRLPLVLGATGHRDLRKEDVPRLEQEVARVLQTIRSRYGGAKHGTPLIVLSALAEGADQLIARIALEHGALLIAPLPMATEEYRRDFTPSGAHEFDRLLAHAIAAPVMRLPPGTNPAELHRDQSKRDEQYRSAGLFIARYCHALLALWDGVDNGPAKGGTAEVVGFKRNGIPIDITGSARCSLDAAEIGPVIHILTPRAGNAGPEASVSVVPWGAGERRWEEHSFPVKGQFSRDQRESNTWIAFDSLAKLSCRFNQDSAELDRAAVDSSLDKAFSDCGPAAAVDHYAALKRALELAPEWCSLYGVADALAIVWQRRFRNAWRALFLLALAALLTFDLQTHLFPDTHLEWLFGAYAGFLAVAFVLFIHARWRESQERFLDYRALAEALRVAIFWRLVGVMATEVSDAYPIKQPSELAWVKTCLRMVELLDLSLKRSEPDMLDANNYQWARALWVGGQFTYFNNQAQRHHGVAENRESLSLALMAFAIALAGGLSVLSFLLRLDHLNWSYCVAVFAIGVLPGMAALWAGYTEQLGLKAQARQYDRMRSLFERAYELLPERFSNSTVASAHKIYEELGKEAMNEHAEWVAIYRQRPIRPPQG